MKTTMAEIRYPGLVEMTRKLATPKTMLVVSANRADVRSMYQPTSGAQTDCANW